jgi:AcrR family transcriptional regulator
MADARLTNGAFYAHFESKDDLVGHSRRRSAARAVRERRGAGGTRLRRDRADRRWYLSPQHRDSPDDGCPSAALLDEIGRSPAATSQAYTDGVLAVVDGIYERLAPDGFRPSWRRR